MVNVRRKCMEPNLDQSIQSSDFLEILTTKETLKRLKIGRTKLFGLLKKGTLLPGRHFFRNGRILRFVWGPELIMAMHENPDNDPGPTNQGAKKSEMNKTRLTNKSSINLSY